MTDPKSTREEINPAIGAMLAAARDALTHEHSLFRSLGLKPLLLGRGRTQFSIDLPADFDRGDGYVHGGLIGIIIDSIMGLTVFTALDEFKPIATVNLRTDHMGRPQVGERAVCACECYSIVDEIAFVTGKVTAEESGTLLATGNASFMVGTRGSAKGSRL